MHNSQKGLLPFRHGVYLFKEQCPKTYEGKKRMNAIPYASVVESLMYAIYFVLDQISVMQWAWSTNINLILDQNIRPR